MTKVNQEFLNSTVANTNKTVSEYLATKNEELPPAHLQVQSINKEEWDKVKFSNFENSYDINKDIYAMLYSLSEKSYPVSIRKIKIEDTSTSMDYIYTYSVDMEAQNG